MCRHFRAGGDLYRRKFARSSQDEERQVALYVRQKEDRNDAKKRKGNCLNLRGNEARSRGVVEGTRNRGGCTSKRETGMTKDRDRAGDIFFYFKRERGSKQKGAHAWHGGRAGLGTG
jgi:hypothetical protein